MKQCILFRNAEEIRNTQDISIMSKTTINLSLHPHDLRQLTTRHLQTIKNSKARVHSAKKHYMEVWDIIFKADDMKINLFWNNSKKWNGLYRLIQTPDLEKQNGSPIKKNVVTENSYSTRTNIPLWIKIKNRSLPNSREHFYYIWELFCKSRGNTTIGVCECIYYLNRLVKGLSEQIVS